MAAAEFKLTPKQRDAIRVLSCPAQNSALRGGSRSGKTFLYLRMMVGRALRAPGSKHLVLRHRFNHLRSTVLAETYPKVLALCYPGIAANVSRTEWVHRLQNGSEVWFGGLDEGPRTEKVLGAEYVTILLNECSQITWEARAMVATRLAQLVSGPDGSPMALRMCHDYNPPTNAHWTYLLFEAHMDPETRRPLKHPEDYVVAEMNPRDNAENLSPEYLRTLEGLPERFRLRFLEGKYADHNPDALFSLESIGTLRELGTPPDMVRIVIAVDPSGARSVEDTQADEIGIVAGGLGTDGNAYLLEDLTMRGSPGEWGAATASAAKRLGADVIVYERNFGGAMAESVIKAACTRASIKVAIKEVVASRGKVQRAEPFSALYEPGDGRVRHAGEFVALENELIAFSTHGYTAEGSPNRADAWLWALAEMFPRLLTGAQKAKPKVSQLVPRQPMPGGGDWMAA